jgi:hypothetical protein
MRDREGKAECSIWLPLLTQFAPLDNMLMSVYTLSMKIDFPYIKISWE